MNLEDKLLFPDWQDYLYDCWEANKGITVNMLLERGMNRWEWEDNMQMAYEAFHKAVLVFRQKQTGTLLQYYRMTLKHACWQKLATHRKDCMGEIVIKEISPEDEFFSLLLWERVEELLGRENAMIYAKYYWQELSFAEISKDLNISKEATRRRVVRGNNKLRKDNVVKGIAEHFGYVSE